MKVVLNVGGGSKGIAIPPHYAGWRHAMLDIDPRCKPDLLLDARQLHTLPPAAFDAVYISHNLENYHRHEGSKVIDTFSRILKPGGFVEVHTSNLQNIMEHVVLNDLDLDDELYLSAENRPILVRDVFWGYHVAIETNGNDFYLNKTGFTPKSLTRFFAGRDFPVSAVTSDGFELIGFFFKRQPSPAQRQMLGLNLSPPSGRS